ncbi:hypothetical protein [Terrisporobacter muris]|uniref:Uncharacterized protein n=1 Tax=Terrisporobacter muris TaxID=2963284 RepID=A0A9X2S182_9FIRM|nr:hypothetical protein [Terrisporobacter muris]MCR1822630.1 hypothetical protein [Terrisporobacter muris]
MSNWIVEKIIKNKLAKIESKKEFIKMCELERENYLDWLNTADTYEAKNNEYWRAAKVMAEVQLKEYQDELKEINDMLQDDTKEYDILYEAMNDNIPYLGVI